MEEGLAAQAAGVTNTYGSGEGQNTKHYYAGAKIALKQKKRVMACNEKSGKK